MLFYNARRMNGWIDFDAYLGSGRNQSNHPLFRAAVTTIGVGASIPQEITYRISSPLASLRGSLPRRIIFETLPPVLAEWSITVLQNKYLSPHPSGIVALGSQNRLVQRKSGVGYELWLQPDPPESPEHINWLPVPSNGSYELIARFFHPSQQILDGEWTMPPVIPIS